MSFKVGWTLTSDQGSAIFFEPTRLSDNQVSNPARSGGVESCPAVRESEKRILVIRSPYTIRLRAARESGHWSFRAVYPFTKVQESDLRKVIAIQPRDLWRDPSRPILQIALPYVFFSDEPAYINQIDPAWRYGDSKNWSVIPGRFDIFAWQRPINWAISWEDPSNDLVIRRGQPMCYLLFETNSPEASLSLVRSRMDDDLRSAIESTKGVTNFVQGTTKLMKKAGLKRSRNLLK